jgi:hypothetical protein
MQYRCAEDWAFAETSARSHGISGTPKRIAPHGLAHSVRSHRLAPLEIFKGEIAETNDQEILKL